MKLHVPVDKAQELSFCLSFLGPTMHGTYCSFSWCSAATRSSYSEVFWIARREELRDYLQDSSIYSVVGRLTASNYKMVLEELSLFFLQFQSSSLCVYFYTKVADCISDFDVCNPWMLCKIPTVIKQYLLVDIQMSHMSKEFIQWHTQLK